MSSYLPKETLLKIFIAASFCTYAFFIENQADSKTFHLEETDFSVRMRLSNLRDPRIQRLLASANGSNNEKIQKLIYPLILFSHPRKLLEMLPILRRYIQSEGRFTLSEAQLRELGS